LFLYELRGQKVDVINDAPQEESVEGGKLSQSFRKHIFSQSLGAMKGVAIRSVPGEEP
jgi:hypothetical protein